MAGSGGPYPNRLVTFLEVHFSRNWYIPEQPYTSDGFVIWEIPQHESGTIIITRSDGKVLSFNGQGDDFFAVQMLGNVIRWPSRDVFPGSGGSFQ